LRENTLRDVLQSDYWRASKEYAKEAAKSFRLESATEKEMMDYTKNFTIRHRLNREIEFTEDFRKQYLTKEYGNIEKYQRNSVEVKVEKGENINMEDKFYELYADLIKRLPTGEAEMHVKKENH
jgi:hypothetical protein